MKHLPEDKLENDLTIFSNMKEVGSPNFFYTRLTARMEDESISRVNGLSINPILGLCALSMFIFINSLLIEKDTDIVKSNTDKHIEALAAEYDQTITN